MKTEDKPTEENKEDSSGKKEPLKVVLADDDKDDQEIFKDAAEETALPVDVTTVNNGKELMEHLKDESIPNPDLIFIDINMPGKNGKECLKEIKNDENLKDIPAVMYTTSTNEKDIEQTHTAGADLYVVKPTSFRKLIMILKKIFLLTWKGLLKPFRKKNYVVSEDNINDQEPE